MTSNLQYLLGKIGQPGIYSSSHDFAATWASATTLTLNGLGTFPLIWQGVIEIPVAGGRWKSWLAQDFIHTFASTGAGSGTLTVAGANKDGIGFTTGSVYWVIFAGQLKGIDTTTNSYQMSQINARQQDLTSVQTLFESKSVAAAADTAWVNTEGFTEMGIFFFWTSGATDEVHGLDITVIGNPTDTGVVEYKALTSELDNATPEIDMYDAPLHFLQASGGAVAMEVYGWVRVKVSTATRVMLSIIETSATTQGDIDVYVKLINR